MTIQASDQIRYNGKATHLISSPYLPKENLGIIARGSSLTVRSDCWKGYVSWWEINKNKLYLSNLSGNFKMLSDKPPILADWYSGTLIIPGSDTIFPWGAPPEMSMHEKEIHVNIEKGLVVKTKIVDFKNELLFMGYKHKKEYLAQHNHLVAEARQIIKQITGD
jgi:hypothetical protein